MLVVGVGVGLEVVELVEVVIYCSLLHGEERLRCDVIFILLY